MNLLKKFCCFGVVLGGLISFEFNNSSMKQVTVNNLDKLTAATDAGFQDEKFYSCIVEAVGKTEGTVLTDSELASIDTLVCKNKGVTNVSGIEKLTSLTSLNLEENDLSSVDLSNNTKLMYLNLSDNTDITSIDLSKNVNLEKVNFDCNKLTSINLSNNINLVDVTLSANKLSSLDISKNSKIIKFYASSNQLTSLDLSNNTSIERMDISLNKISSIDISKLTNLKAVALSANKLSSLNVTNNTLLESLYASSNQLTSVDVSKNIKLINIDLSDNKISNFDVTNNLKLEYLRINKNKLSSIDIKNNTLLEKLVISANGLSSIDLSNNVNLVELYISSNNLTSLDISKLSKLAHLNAVLNRFDSLSIPNPENIINLAVEAGWIANYDFDKFTKLKSLRLIDYYIIPVYGTKFEVSNLSNYKSSNVSYNDYVVYTDFNKTGSSYVNSSSTINGTLGNTLKYRVCSTNISGYHNYCGGEDEFDDITKLVVDNNVSANGIGNYSGIVYYEGYREFRFMSLTSDKYVINENNSTIDVGGDSDDEIKSNLKVSYKDAVIDIDGNSLKVAYNGKPIREFTLQRVETVPTGSLSMFITIGIMLVGIIGFVIYRKKLLDSKI